MISFLLSFSLREAGQVGAAVIAVAAPLPVDLHRKIPPWRPAAQAEAFPPGVIVTGEIAAEAIATVDVVVATAKEEGAAATTIVVATQAAAMAAKAAEVAAMVEAVRAEAIATADVAAAIARAEGVAATMAVGVVVAAMVAATEVAEVQTVTQTESTRPTASGSI
jgi:hypothetical protein